ncbi:MAG: carboxypeptidase regulatory-like domain-containing protein [Bacteroidetes bacterium]|nr:carboxypeptidase regulatory-like domain-containing protein [Bacteroidota bacterium]
MRRLLLFLCLFCFAISSRAQYLRVSGYVADSSLAPIPDVAIFITNGSIVGSTDASGHYSIELRTGDYQLVFTHSHFQQVKVNVVLSDRNDTLNVILPGLVQNIGVVDITARYKDPGPEMMRRAIARREYWAAKQPPQSAEVYIRAFEQYNKPKKTVNVWAETSKDTSAKKKKKNQENDPEANMAEILLTRDFQPPDKIKETRTGVSIRGDKTGLFYTSTTEGSFDFYTNLMKIPGLGDMPVMSPLSGTALLAYKFNFLGSYKDEKGRRILKIKMQPRALSNSVFSGEIHLVDTLFYIYRIEAEYPKTQLNEYNQFVVSQEYGFSSDSIPVLQRQRFDYYAKAGKGKYSGYTLVAYRNLELHKSFTKRYFGLEKSSSTDSAYDRDTAFWNRSRVLPLNSSEIRFMNRSDSVKRVHNSKEYLDSIEKVTNKITLTKLFLKGQEYQNREKGWNLDFQPLMFIVQPWFPGGTRINLWNTMEKKFKSKREISFVENISYGINNKDVRGTVIFNTLYNPYRRANIYLSAGRDFGLVNGNAAYLDLFRRANFYQNTHFSAYHRQEIVNGLFLRVMGEFSDRKDISNFKFDSFGDSLFENNRTLSFQSHRAFFADFTLSYTPGQKYIREPRQKVILGSRWPTLVLQYRKALPGVFNSSIDYDYLEARVEHDFPLGLLGRSEFRAVSGSFLTRKNVSVIDYRYQRRGDVFLFTPPMYAYQTLDSTFITWKRFYEFHYRHHFNGALVNRLPFLKPLRIRESAGGNILYAPERRGMLFYEVYGGIDKLIRIWRERFKIGIYYSVGYSNIFEKPRYGFKINFEYFDRRNNSW